MIQVVNSFLEEITYKETKEEGIKLDIFFSTFMQFPYPKTPNYFGKSINFLNKSIKLTD